MNVLLLMLPSHQQLRVLTQEDEARELVAAMVDNHALESLVQRLGTFNEANDDEAEAVTNTLAIFENIVELSPHVRLALTDWRAVAVHIPLITMGCCGCSHAAMLFAG